MGQIGDSGDSLVVRQVRDSHLQGQVGVITKGEVGDNQRRYEHTDGHLGTGSS
jgi:hypothetical protein